MEYLPCTVHLNVQLLYYRGSAMPGLACNLCEFFQRTSNRMFGSSRSCLPQACCLSSYLRSISICLK